MVILYSIPSALSSLAIAAHFYRNDLQPVAILCLLAPMLMLLKRSWIPKVMTILLLLYSLEWLRTMLNFIDQYTLQERPFGKLAMILSSVIVFTLLSSVVFRSQPMKQRYRQEN